MPQFRTGTRACWSIALFVILPLALAAQTWAPTATQAVVLSNATDLGPLPATTAMHITVGLQLPNIGAVRQLVASQNTPGDPLYGTELTPDQFAASYAPTASQVQAVTSYLTTRGFTNIAVEPNNMLVTADGSTAAVNAAFNTQIDQLSVNGNLVFGNIRAAQVPSNLGGMVLAVLGLNNAYRMSLPSSSPSTPSGIKVCGPIGSVVCPVSFYTPVDFQKAYDVGTTPTGQKTAIAIFAFGSVAGVVTDLRVAEQQNKLPQVPVVIKQVGIPNSTDFGGGEWQLDTQMSTGMAQTVKTLFIYTVTNPFDSDTTLLFNRFVTDKLARAGSASFGLCEEFAFADGSMVLNDQIFLQGAAQGQTVFASTGDQGSACPVTGLTNGVPLSGVPGAVEYPASSPYVVAVGGTQLFTDSNGNYVVENGWEAGGGGISAVENCTHWQNAANVPSCVANNSRGVPDVAMDAALETGGLVYIGCPPNDPNANNDCLFITGGTSMSSPLALGVWARLQSASNNKFGYASPQLYGRYSFGPPPSDPGFHDILTGSNGAYTALPGWDFVTGLGSFDVAKFCALNCHF